MSRSWKRSSRSLHRPSLASRHIRQPWAHLRCQGNVGIDLIAVASWCPRRSCPALGFAPSTRRDRDAETSRAEFHSGWATRACCPTSMFIAILAARSHRGRNSVETRRLRFICTTLRPRSKRDRPRTNGRGRKSIERSVSTPLPCPRCSAAFRRRRSGGGFRRGSAGACGRRPAIGRRCVV